jgi:hypothetical protein
MQKKKAGTFGSCFLFIFENCTNLKFYCSIKIVSSILSTGGRMFAYRRPEERIRSVRENDSTGVQNGDELNSINIILLALSVITFTASTIFEFDAGFKKDITKALITAVYLISLWVFCSRVGLIVGFFKLSLHKRQWSSKEASALGAVFVISLLVSLGWTLVYSKWSSWGRNSEPDFFNTLLFLAHLFWMVGTCMFYVWFIKYHPRRYVSSPPKESSDYAM